MVRNGEYSRISEDDGLALGADRERLTGAWHDRVVPYLPTYWLHSQLLLIVPLESIFPRTALRTTVASVSPEPLFFSFAIVLYLRYTKQFGGDIATNRTFCLHSICIQRCPMICYLRLNAPLYYRTVERIPTQAREQQNRVASTYQRLGR